MSNFANRLKSEREKRKDLDPKWTQGYTADYIGVARTTYTAYENGTKQPPLNIMNKIADMFQISTDLLLGRDSEKSSTDESEVEKESGNRSLVESPEYQQQRDHDRQSKDEKDIAKRMQQIRNDLTGGDGLNFNGEPMSEEAVESLLDAMEYAVRQTQRINKKYIPKKYRDNENND